MSSIVILYLAFPFYYKIFKRHPFITTVLFSLLSVFIFIFDEKCIAIFVTRVPIFLLGILIGEYTYEKRRISTIWLYIAYIASILGFCFLYYIYYHQIIFYYTGGMFYPAYFIVLGCLLVFCHFLNFLKGRFFIQKICAFYGALSYELYLIHYFFQNFLTIC